MLTLFHPYAGAPLHAMPQAMNSAIDPNMLLGPALAPDGGQAAMAHLLAMRSEVMALHLSVKLFHCTPQELPDDAQEQLTAWLRQAPACTELYVRSGCVHLTVTVFFFRMLPFTCQYLSDPNISHPLKDRRPYLDGHPAVNRRTYIPSAYFKTGRLQVVCHAVPV